MNMFKFMDVCFLGPTCYDKFPVFHKPVNNIQTAILGIQSAYVTCGYMYVAQALGKLSCCQEQSLFKIYAYNLNMLNLSIPNNIACNEPLLLGVNVRVLEDFTRMLNYLSFQYLHKRFSMSVRIAGAFLFIIQTLFYMAIVLYAPALAINAGKTFDL